MRFLHTADWHLGKKLHGFGLLEEQKEAYRQILAIAKREKVDAIVIAGDLYDRSLPGEDAVLVLNEMLQHLNLDEKFPVLAISGNHDSAVRLGTGTSWFKATHFYLNTTLEEAFSPILIADTQFFLLPYFEPIQARKFFKRDDIHTISEAMQLVVGELEKHFDPSKKQVLVAHFFVAGSSTTESETKLTVGGLDVVSVDLLRAFDYVALGHLHGKNALNDPKARYSGSPVKFSTSEAQQDKGVWIVDMATTPVSLTFEKLEPLRDIVELKGAYAEISSADFYRKLNRDAFFSITLTDRVAIPNVMQELRTIYPNIINLERENGALFIAKEKMSNEERQLDPIHLLEKFFKETTDHQMTENQSQLAQKALVVEEQEIKREEKEGFDETH